MTFKRAVYNRVPDFLQPAVERLYFNLKGEETNRQIRSRFISEFFDSRSEYETYAAEFKESYLCDIRADAVEEYRQLTDRQSMVTIPIEEARDYYAIVRHLQPTVIVETGVCHGLSTLSILLALRKNESGHLYSVDYPFYIDESLEEFREETYDEFGGAALPEGKQPGWIIPTEYRDRWTLKVGKSQRELPKLLPELDGLDLFIHDSEHSTPCMMFEYELAWEWLGDSGVILSDDINWGEAWSLFIEDRQPESGEAMRNVGYMVKDGR